MPNQLTRTTRTTPPNQTSQPTARQAVRHPAQPESAGGADLRGDVAGAQQTRPAQTPQPTPNRPASKRLAQTPQPEARRPASAPRPVQTPQPTSDRALSPAANVVRQGRKALPALLQEYPMPRPKDDARPRVLIVVDDAGWAFGSIAGQVAPVLAPEYAVGVQTFRGLRSDPVDVAVLLWWGCIASFRPNVRARKIVLGVFDEYSWRIADRAARWRSALAASHAIVAGNRRIADGLRASGVKLPIHLTEDGVDTRMFRPTPLPLAFTAGWAGNSARARGADIKGVGLITEAAKLAGVPLVLADAATARRPKSEMPAFYAGLSVYVCASDKEGTPNPVLEAMACGRPVITTDVGIVPEVVTPASGIVVERSVEAIAAALTTLKTMPKDQFATMGSAARRAAETFDWAKKTPAWKAAIDAVLAS